MSILKISGNNLIVGDKVTPREDLFSREFLKYSDEQADNYYIDHYCVNEMFVYQVQKYLTLKFFIEQNDTIEEIEFDKPSLDLKFYAINIAKEKGLKVNGGGFWQEKKNKAQSLFLNFASFAFLFLKMIRIPKSNDEITVSDKFTVLRKRSKQSIQRFKKFDGIQKEIEDVYSKDSVYRLFPRSSRIGWVLRGYSQSIKDFRTISKFYGPKVGNGTVSLMYQWYAKRAVHTALFSELLAHYMPFFKGKTYYTGSNLDRYSVVEEIIAAKNDIKTVCIPHGLEYGYKFPKGFSCEFCYTTGEETAKHLNRLYQTDKFKWDEEVAIKMFKLDGSKPHPQMVVFFTEPREVHVHYKIIEELAPMLKNIGVKLYLKLHPADNPHDYDGLHLDIITDYNLSLTNNICIARKSTTLLEAIYNGSKAIAIITNALDQNFFDTFPSLKTDIIIKTYSVIELFEVIKSNMSSENNDEER